MARIFRHKNLYQFCIGMGFAVFFATAYLYCCRIKNRKCSPPVRDRPAISFSGCGIRYQFYGGVAEYLLDNFDTKNIDILCVSGGIYAATILAVGRKMTEWCDRDWQMCFDYWTKRSLYLFWDTDIFQRTMWRNYLPENAHQICSGRLHITVSRLGFYGFYEDIISEYANNEDIIDAIIGTIHIPGLFRHIPIVRGKYAFDGCYMNLMPRTTAKTLFVKLFGRGHIDYGNRLALTKVMSIVIPEYNNGLIREGYEIASRRHQTFVEHGFVN
jgi:hypothetical protein